MSLGSNIRHFREEKKISEQDLAAMLASDVQDVFDWESGFSEPPKEILEKMASIFGVETSAFYSKKNNQPIGRCCQCGKTIYEGDEHGYGAFVKKASGLSEVVFRYDPSLTSGDSLFCGECCGNFRLQEETALRQRKAAFAVKRKKGIGWSLAVGLLFLLAALSCGVAFWLVDLRHLAILFWSLSPVAGLFAFSFVYVLIANNTYLSDVFFAFFRIIVSFFASFKIPESKDVLPFLYVLRIVFAPLVFVAFLLGLIVNTFVCALLSPLFLVQAIVGIRKEESEIR